MHGGGALCMRSAAGPLPCQGMRHTNLYCVSVCLDVLYCAASKIVPAPFNFTIINCPQRFVFIELGLSFDYGKSNRSVLNVKIFLPWLWLSAVLLCCYIHKFFLSKKVKERKRKNIRNAYTTLDTNRIIYEQTKLSNNDFLFSDLIQFKTVLRDNYDHLSLVVRCSLFVRLYWFPYKQIKVFRLKYNKIIKHNWITINMIIIII